MIASLFVLCAALQIDSLRILEQLSTVSELRGKLVMGVEATLDRADRMLTLIEDFRKLATRALQSVGRERATILTRMLAQNFLSCRVACCLKARVGGGSMGEPVTMQRENRCSSNSRML